MRRRGFGGVHPIPQLLFFGSLCLLMSAAADGFVMRSAPSLTTAALMAQAVLLSILGFLCTNNASEYLKPSQEHA